MSAKLFHRQGNRAEPQPKKNMSRYMHYNPEIQREFPSEQLRLNAIYAAQEAEEAAEFAKWEKEQAESDAKWHDYEVERAENLERFRD